VRALQDAPIRARLAAIRGYRHLGAVVFAAPDRRADGSAVFVDRTRNQNQVGALHAAGGQLGRQGFVRGVVLGDGQQAGRVLVYAMHDARTLDAADAGQVLAVMQQGVDERAGVCARRGMHDHIRRLVDDDDVAVLIDDVQRDVFRLRRRVFGRGTQIAIWAPS